MKYLFLLLFLITTPEKALADNLTTQHIGNFAYTNGYINGQSYNAATQRIGSFEYTNGTYGNQPFNTTTQQIGGFKYTNGNLPGVGNLPTNNLYNGH